MKLYVLSRVLEFVWLIGQLAPIISLIIRYSRLWHLYTNNEYIYSEEEKEKIGWLSDIVTGSVMETVLFDIPLPTDVSNETRIYESDQLILSLDTIRILHLLLLLSKKIYTNNLLPILCNILKASSLILYITRVLFFQYVHVSWNSIIPILNELWSF